MTVPLVIFDKCSIIVRPCRRGSGPADGPGVRACPSAVTRAQQRRPCGAPGLRLGSAVGVAARATTSACIILQEPSGLSQAALAFVAFETQTTIGTASFSGPPTPRERQAPSKTFIELTNVGPPGRHVMQLDELVHRQPGFMLSNTMMMASTA